MQGNRTKAFGADRQAVGEVIREARKRCGYSQQQLSKLIGATGDSVFKYENGEAMPSLITAKRLSLALEITMDELTKDIK